MTRLIDSRRFPSRSSTFLAGVLILFFALGCDPRTPWPSEVEVIVAGHSEALLDGEGQALPLAIGDDPLRLCLVPPSALDTSQWMARLGWRGLVAVGARWQSPNRRMDTTLCFEVPKPARNHGVLCGVVRDGFDGRRYTLPCRPVAYRVGDGTRERLQKDFLEALRGGPDLRALEALASHARVEGHPARAVQIELTRVHFLKQEGSPSALSAARQVLASLPSFLDQPAFSTWRAQADHLEGAVEQGADGPLVQISSRFERAEKAYRRVADERRLGVTMARADLLATWGTAEAARRRLASALDACQREPCSAHLIGVARGMLAWLTVQDPDATGSDVVAAEAAAREAAEAVASADPLESANHRINEALLRVQRGADPTVALAEARPLLATATIAGRRRQLEGYALLAEGLAALKAGDAGLAGDRCQAAAQDAEAGLGRWALDCAARAARSTGALADAARHWDEALAVDEASLGSGAWTVPLGSGRRADLTYGAARLAVERGRPDEAWRLLARLDVRTADEEARRRCREDAKDPETRAQWRALAVRRDALEAEIDALGGPVGPARAVARNAVRRRLLDALQTLARTWPGCHREPAAIDDTGLDFRAFALEDEIILLARTAAGGVSVAARTPVDRKLLRARIETVTSALHRRHLDDEALRALLEPLAPALVPSDLASRPSPARFGLHGPLQAVPLTALPRPDGGVVGGSVALRPASVRPSSTAREDVPTGPAVFVVDPSRDLPAGPMLAQRYRERFPGSRVLEGAAAHAESVREALRGAAWLHVDAHGRYDPSVPELAGLALADGVLRLSALADLDMPRHFANLSGCDTGRWPATADSGRYGLGGALTRRGVPWVVASRAPLGDAVAAVFGEVFYREIAARQTVPQAYAAAHGAVRERFPIAHWAPLVLLDGAAGDARTNFFSTEGGNGTSG